MNDETLSGDMRESPVCGFYRATPMINSYLMIDYPAATGAAARHSCSMCGGSGRVGVIQPNETQPIKVKSCPLCAGTGKAKEAVKRNWQFNLRTLLITTAIVPPLLAWGIWIVGELNFLGCIFSIIPIAFYGTIAVFCRFVRTQRRFSMVPAVFCAISVSLVMPASEGSEFLESGFATAVFSTVVGGFITVCWIIGYGAIAKTSNDEFPC